jgi:hypothetical protein
MPDTSSLNSVAVLDRTTEKTHHLLALKVTSDAVTSPIGYLVAVSRSRVGSVTLHSSVKHGTLSSGSPSELKVRLV